jgi:hypothetical protein
MKVSYHKRFHPTEGTVYDQAVSMKRSELIHLNMAIVAEIAGDYPKYKKYTTEGEHHAKMFLKQAKIIDGICYLNLTQMRFMKTLMLEDGREKMKNRNTCVLVRG